VTYPHVSRVIDSPLGTLVLEARDEALTALRLPGSAPASSIGSHGSSRLLDQASEQLQQYFNRERQGFDLPLALRGTEFQRLVWSGLLQIPYGTTLSYGAFARVLDHPTSSRAIGQANARNPIPIIVPCHRVVASRGLGGYSGGLAAKEVLLNLEAGASCSSSCAGPALMIVPR
jgi:methylated-DNA-[protein]-cysteine S-methyltransferase